MFVSVLSVPTNEEVWSPRLRVYLKAITKYHARKKETPLGTLMVTNLSGFPSALTVIAIPDGDIRKHKADFIVNENMKRLGCAGRAGLNLSQPIGATQAKFMRLYKTSDRVPIYSAVIELVKLCQVALMLFDKLAPEYTDGLLCDVTEQAINNWWTEIGTEFFNVDPTDGILGPTTVAALLGLLLGARNRLHAFGAPVAKDVFDLATTKRALASFQKSQKLERTRRLDLQTLQQLHKVSAKAASGQGWTVPRAVKSTVAELSGKGGDMVMGMVGGRDRSGIAEVETLDIDTFVQLANGERCKWLWHGKPLKNNEPEPLKNAGYENGLFFSDDEHGGYTWSSPRRDSILDDYPRLGTAERAYTLPSHGSQTNLDPANKDLALRRTVLKSVTGKMTDARSGLGRIKDAVGKTGLRGHYHKYSKDGNFASDGESTKETPVDGQFPSTMKASDAWVSHQVAKLIKVDEGGARYSVHSRRGSSIPDDALEAKKNVQNSVLDEKTIDTDAESLSSLDSDSRNLRLEDHRLGHFRNANKYDRNSVESFDSIKVAEPEDASNLPATKSGWRKQSLYGSDLSILLRRSRSLSQLRITAENTSYQYRWPRHLSFSAVVDVVAAGTDFDTPAASESYLMENPDAALALENSLALNAQVTAARLQDLRTQDGSWAEQKVEDVNDFDTQSAKDQETLDHMYRQKLEEYDALRDASVELIMEEKVSLTEMIKEIDTLGAKLDYEVTALQSKVDDVENGVAEFERQVIEIERRAKELQLETRDRGSWFLWVLNFFSGNTKPGE